MPDIAEGESVQVQGSARLPYVLRNVAGVYSCNCPAWRNQSLPIDQRTCKHLRQYRGAAAEAARLGQGTAATLAKASTAKRVAPPLLLAESWDGKQEIAGWWISEKLDGVRALWDGTQFLSRQGNRFHAPAWFTADLPSMPLDGELWLGRQQFQRAVSIVRRADGGERWRELRFVVFDAPELAEPFERRLAQLQMVFHRCRPSYSQLLLQDRCRDADHLHRELDRITAQGGEGLMLRQPESLYEAGRSLTLLKVKRFLDAEAVVLEYLPGTGRHRGRLGALRVRLANDVEFSVGSGFSDAQREAPPPIGTTITFRYQELTTAGVPRFPTFVRVRRA